MATKKALLSKTAKRMGTEFGKYLKANPGSGIGPRTKSSKRVNSLLSNHAKVSPQLTSKTFGVAGRAASKATKDTSFDVKQRKAKVKRMKGA